MRITVTLPDELVERIDKLGKDHDLSRAWHIRQAVFAYVDGMEDGFPAGALFQPHPEQILRADTPSLRAAAELRAQVRQPVSPGWVLDESHTFKGQPGSNALRCSTCGRKKGEH